MWLKSARKEISADAQQNNPPLIECVGRAKGPRDKALTTGRGRPTLPTMRVHDLFVECPLPSAPAGRQASASTLDRVDIQHTRTYIVKQQPEVPSREEEQPRKLYRR